MVSKILAWSAFGTTILFAILAVVSLFYRRDLGDSWPLLVWYGVIPLLALSILLAVALLVWSAFARDS